MLEVEVGFAQTRRRVTKINPSPSWKKSGLKGPADVCSAPAPRFHTLVETCSVRTLNTPESEHSRFRAHGFRWQGLSAFPAKQAAKARPTHAFYTGSLRQRSEEIGEPATSCSIWGGVACKAAYAGQFRPKPPD